MPQLLEHLTALESIIPEVVMIPIRNYIKEYAHYDVSTGKMIDQDRPIASEFVQAGIKIIEFVGKEAQDWLSQHTDYFVDIPGCCNPSCSNVCRVISQEAALGCSVRCVADAIHILSTFSEHNHDFLRIKPHMRHCI